MLQIYGITCALFYLILAKNSDFQLLLQYGQDQSVQTLTQFQPVSSLLSFPVLMSVIGQTIIQLQFQYIFILHYVWYLSNLTIHEGNTNDRYAMMINYENTSLYLYSSFQYIFQCISFSMGKPFRREFIQILDLLVF
ncbi:unnamed protein product (macronuclear) [Paramecium tetraurelia]|uniref:Transmembrane protein n=1 Tax=Paramecium tetraurelia TaxID=5888 RepID=A0CI52_PARTE|nr:uncharacterized protein GSPATT00038573001 [Paramecium tetraurelia]CAK70469.1 unnamed protein product [Paramecium tetraurelia]|eukprot:XP_001437866.1 hypothetical protein (macronuclear) [Paramecium tetraurelia strain d4-2]